MEQFNEDAVRRIWQRVQQSQAPRIETAGALAIQELSLRRQLLQLGRRTSGRYRAELYRMAEQCRDSAGVLRGMCMMGGEAEAEPEKHSDADAPMRRCYARMLTLLREYEKRRTDPQFGPVYEGLAGRKQSQCHRLLALAGQNRLRNNRVMERR